MEALVTLALGVVAILAVVLLVALLLAALGAGIGLFFGAILWAIERCVGPMAVAGDAPAALPWWGWLGVGMLLGGGLFTVKVTRKGGA